jgi:putative DNA primase/helicase
VTPSSAVAPFVRNEPRDTPAPSEREPGLCEPAAGVVLTRLSSVQPMDVEWLWPGRLARGKYTLIAGDPGTGKTSLLLDCASRLSRPGSTWADGSPAPDGTSLLLTAEDGLADTIRPRVDRYGGDPERIVVLEAVRERGSRRPLDLARDVALLIGAIRELRPALVGMDPITAYLGRTDAHRDAEVRGLLAPLMAALDEYRAAFVGLAHLTKDQTRGALHRPGGSVAFVAAARLAFVVAADPEDPNRRILAPLKTNLCRRPDPLAFRLDADHLLWEASPATGLDAEMLLRPAAPGDREDQTDAERVIRELLADAAAWPLDARQALDAGQARGVSERTMRRTAARMHIRIARVGFGSAGRWLWHRPAVPPAIADTTGPYLTDLSPMAAMTEQAGTEATRTIEDRETAFSRARDPRRCAP